MVSRQSALCAAFVALLVYGAQLAHWVLLSHEICASHGEIVHDGDHAEHEAAPHARVAADEAPSQASELTRNGGDEEEHDHCDALANEAAGCTVDAPSLSASLSWQLVVTSPTLSALTVERLYLLAPKTSPPSVS